MDINRFDVDLETIVKIRVNAYKYWKNLLSTVTNYYAFRDIETLTHYLQPLINQINNLIEDQALKAKILRDCKIKQNIVSEV